MRFHHLGLAVQELEAAVASYGAVFGHRVISGPFDDPVQNVRVVFLAAEEQPEFVVELVAPLGEGSPVDRILQGNSRAYHVCYEVDDLDAALTRVRAAGAVVLYEPVPAVAYQGRRIAWFVTRDRLVTELVERGQDA